MAQGCCHWSMIVQTRRRVSFMVVTGRIAAASAGMLLASSFAHGQVFSSTNPIMLPAGAPTATFGPASIYPLTITVSGLTGGVADLNVSVFDLFHSFSDDVDILLVGPNGANVMLMAGAGGSTALLDFDFTFDDQASQMMPNTNPPLTAGTYLPSNYEPLQGMPLPAPGGPYGNSLSVFNGINPNGDWKLYVADDGSGDTGRMEGWALEFTMVPSPGAMGLLMIGF